MMLSHRAHRQKCKDHGTQKNPKLRYAMRLEGEGTAGKGTGKVGQERDSNAQRSLKKREKMKQQRRGK